MSKAREVEERWAALVTFYREASSQVSSIIRQLTFAGFAFAWLFKVDLVPGGGWSIPSGIGCAIGLLVLSLLIDICQYLLTSFTLDRALTAGESPDLSQTYLAVMHWLWRAKVVATLLGFAVLFISAFGQLHFR
jgi:hypothetical protein